MRNIFSRLFPVMLTLSTDADAFARGLFEPLTKQTIHWITSNQYSNNPDTLAMLGAIMNAIADPLQSGLREFGAACLGEFIK